MESTATNAIRRVSIERNSSSSTAAGSRSLSFSLCLRPVVMDECSDRSSMDECSDRSSLSSASTSSSSSNPVFSYAHMDIPEKSRSRRSAKVGECIGLRRSFSRVLKAVLLETCLAKKNRKKKLRRQKLHSESERHYDISHAKTEKIWDGDNYVSLSSRSFSSAKTSAWRSSTNPRCFQADSMGRRRATGEKEKGLLYRSNACFCLLLFSLTVLIFWGRVSAIICTTTWFLFVPRWSSRMANSPEIAIDSSEYKKRVIMEGLLERNRGHSHRQ